MPDPNDILVQIQMKIADVARSKTALGYNSDTMAALGMIVFGRADELRDAIQAPDGQPWRSAMFDEAARRLPLQEAIETIAAQPHYTDVSDAGRIKSLHKRYTNILKLAEKALTEFRNIKS